MRLRVQSRGPEVEVGLMCPRNSKEARGWGTPIRGRFWELRPKRWSGPVCGMWGPLRGASGALRAGELHGLSEVVNRTGLGTS